MQSTRYILKPSALINQHLPCKCLEKIQTVLWVEFSLPEKVRKGRCGTKIGGDIKWRNYQKK